MTSNNNINILFIAPRFHTNQIEFIQELSKLQNVLFLVVGSIKLDTYKNEYIQTIKPSFFQKWANKIFNENDNFVKYSLFYLPDIIWTLKKIFTFKPKAIIIRDSSPLIVLLIVFLYSLLKLDKKTILYTQTPIYKNNISRKRKFIKWILFKFIIKGWYSPVLYRPYNQLSNLEKDEGINFIPFTQSPKLSTPLKPSDTLKFITVSKFEQRKNLILILDAFKQIQSLGLEFEYTIVGQANNDERFNYYNEIKQYIKDQKINNITVLINIDYKILSSMYDKNNVFILYSSDETASVSQLEAMSYGLAVIISKDNGTASYVKDCGIIIGDRTNSELIESIIFCIENKEQVYVFGKNSLNVVRNNHDPASNVYELLKIINNE